MYNHKKLYLIAEVGGNHNGNFNIAKKAIVEAKKAGADCVKFQYYSAENLVHPQMQTMSHVRKNSKEKTQFERFKKLELSLNNVKELNKICKNNKIDFCLSVFGQRWRQRRGTANQGADLALYQLRRLKFNRELRHAGGCLTCGTGTARRIRW